MNDVCMHKVAAIRNARPEGLDDYKARSNPG